MDTSDYGDLAAGAVGVALVGFAEGLGAAKTYAARHHYEVDANRELVGLGTANLARRPSSGMVVNGSSPRRRSTAPRARRARSPASWSR